MEVEQARSELAYAGAMLEAYRRQQNRAQQPNQNQQPQAEPPNEPSDPYANQRRRSFEEQQERMERERQAEKEAFEERLRRRTETTKTPEDLVREAEEKLATAEAKLPTKFAMAMKLLPSQAILFAMEALGACLALLWLRVICEAIMVIFNISLKLTRIDENLRTASNQAARSSQ